MSTVKHLALLVGHDDGTIQPYLGIEFEGKVWLVPNWLVDLSTGVATPERMIRVDSLDPRPMKGDPGNRFDFSNILLPRAVIEDPFPDTSQFEVRNLPDSPRVYRSELRELPTI